MVPKTVNGFIVHKDYNPSTGANDIAIVIIPKKEQFIFNTTVNKIELPKATPPVNTVGTLAGFGFTLPGDNKASEQMQIAELKVVSNDICEKQFRRKLIKQFCAAPMDNKSNVCSGDHGSTLVPSVTDGNEFVAGIAALISPKCDMTSASVYTDVSQYLEWIDDVIG